MLCVCSVVSTAVHDPVNQAIQRVPQQSAFQRVTAASALLVFNSAGTGFFEVSLTKMPNRNIIMCSIQSKMSGESLT